MAANVLININDTGKLSFPDGSIYSVISLSCNIVPYESISYDAVITNQRMYNMYKDIINAKVEEFKTICSQYAEQYGLVLV